MQTKSKQSLFEEIISVSVKKVRENSVAGELDQFQHRMKTVPTKIKELSACPYMFIFDALINFTDQIDFVLTQYQTMINENFLDPSKNTGMLVQHFKKNLQKHSFRIIQIMMEIKDPNLQFMEMFFQIHNSIAMPENVLESFRYTGYKWLARAFAFRQHPRPEYLNTLISGVIKVEDRNLPSLQQQNQALTKYISKILNNMTLTIQNNLKQEFERTQSKYGFCFICEKPADYYCKDTKIPVCGPSCKKLHILQITNNSCIDFQYTQKFKNQIQRMLFANLRRKKNVALSIEYLSTIYLNSDYVPKQELPHRELLILPIIVERIWALYALYYLSKNQVFQHIFADCLRSKVDYIYINSAKYFMRVCQTEHIFTIYKYLDCLGPKRILSIILGSLPDVQAKQKLIYSIIDRIFYSQTLKTVSQISDKIEKQSATQNSLLRAVNYDAQPVEKFNDLFGVKNGLREFCKFAIKNQGQVNRDKIAKVVFAKQQVCKVFLEQLFIEKIPIHSQDKLQKDNNQEQNYQIRLKCSPFIDQILREMFYFLNINIADKIYKLFQILCQVLDFKKMPVSKQNDPNCNQLQVVFSQENTSSPNTFFTFAYFLLQIVTELNKPAAVKDMQKNSKSKDKDKRVSQDQFLNRVKNFDSKFAAKQKQYIVGVYNRLVDLPFTQQSRGVLSKYQAIKRQESSSSIFHPVMILTDNWQTIYQFLCTLKNDIHTLYRCCTVLTNFPTLCQPFFQLLLRKLTNQQTSSQQLQSGSAKAVASAISKQDHLLLYINNILQFEPNCVSHSSWQYLFLRDPLPKADNIYLFELSALVYYSKRLKLSNFIWFAKQFCRQVKLSENLSQVVKLLQDNFIREGSGQIDKQLKGKMQILNKQLLYLFTNEKNIYFQLQFLKNVFKIGNYQLAVNFIDIQEVNSVSAPLIMDMIIQVIQNYWQQFEKQKNRDNKMHKYRQGIDKQKQEIVLQEQKMIKKQSSQGPQIQAGPKGSPEPAQTPKVWTHLLSKSMTITLGYPQFFCQFCNVLCQAPELLPYFQQYSIQYAIQAAMEGKIVMLDPIILSQLSKFERHISQMYSAKFEILNRVGITQGLLQQFINQNNLQIIVKHFVYFWDLEKIYIVLTDYISRQIKQLAEAQKKGSQNENNKQKVVKLSNQHYAKILKVLKQNNYDNIIKLQYKLQPIVGFVSSVVLLLGLQQKIKGKSQISNNIDDRNNEKLDENRLQALSKLQKQGYKQISHANLMEFYRTQLQVIVNEIILPNCNIESLLVYLREYVRDEQEEQGEGKQQPLQLNPCSHLAYAYNIVQSYLNCLYLATQDGIVFSKAFQLEKIATNLHQINCEYHYRVSIFMQMKGMLIYSNIVTPVGMQWQQTMAYIMSIFYGSDTAYQLCNYSFLFQYLQNHKKIYLKLLAQLDTQSQKPKGKKESEKHKKSQHINNKPALVSVNSLNGGSNSSNEITIKKQKSMQPSSMSQMSRGSSQVLSAESIENKDQQLTQEQFQIFMMNKQIKYFAKGLQILQLELQKRLQRQSQLQIQKLQEIKKQNQQEKPENRSKEKNIQLLNKINNVLVELLDNSYDFYNVEKQAVTTKKNSSHILTIYRLINAAQ